MAKRTGPEAHAALLLASAMDREPPDREGNPGTVHGDLVLAWRALRTKGDAKAWEAATKPLGKLRTCRFVRLVDRASHGMQRQRTHR